MPNQAKHTETRGAGRPLGRLSAAGTILLCAVLALQGCFDPVYPQLDREARVMEALSAQESAPLPPTPLTPAEAVAYALRHNLDARVSEIEIAYQNEAAVAAKRRLLPSLTLRYSMDHSNHPSARWSQSTRSGNQSLESSYSSDPNSRQGEVGVMWSVIDFGVGYFRARQHGERIRYSELQRQRVRQQVVLDVLSSYWRASAAIAIAEEAEQLQKELNEQAEAIRDSVEMRILSGAEGARRELSVHGGLAELEQWRRIAVQAKLELARVMGCGGAGDLSLARFPEGTPALPPVVNGDPAAMQAAALKRRPELFQYDSQERVAVDEARIALLQMAPNANLSLSVYDDPDKFLEWTNWMTVGARVSWNLLNIPAKLSERRMAKLQGELSRRKGLALAAAIMAQVGIAYSDWCLSHSYAATLARRADARGRLVEALAAGERDGQTRPGEVLQERVRLLSEKASAMRAAAEARVAGARLANAVGIEVDDEGLFRWELDAGASDLPEEGGVDIRDRHQILVAEQTAKSQLPGNLSGLRVVKAEDFLAEDGFFPTSPDGFPDSGVEPPASRQVETPPAETGNLTENDAKPVRPAPDAPTGTSETPRTVTEKKPVRSDSRSGGTEEPTHPAAPEKIQPAGKTASPGGKPAPERGVRPPAKTPIPAPSREKNGQEPGPGEAAPAATPSVAAPETTARLRPPESGSLPALPPGKAGEAARTGERGLVGGVRLRPEGDDNFWQDINASYATASPAALVPRNTDNDAGPARKRPEAVSAVGEAPSGTATRQEPYQSMRPPEGGMTTVRHLPRTSFIPNPVAEEPAPEAAAGSLLPPRPYAYDDIPPELDARRLERQRALEPLQAIPRVRPLRPPGQAPVAWPGPLDK